MNHRCIHTSGRMDRCKKDGTRQDKYGDWYCEEHYQEAYQPAKDLGKKNPPKK